MRLLPRVSCCHSVGCSLDGIAGLGEVQLVQVDLVLRLRAAKDWLYDEVSTFEHHVAQTKCSRIFYVLISVQAPLYCIFSRHPRVLGLCDRAFQLLVRASFDCDQFNARQRHVRFLTVPFCGPLPRRLSTTMSLFGGQPQTGGGGSLFGNPAKKSTSFGGFGSSTTTGNQPSPGGGGFGSTQNQQQQGTPGGGMFGSTAASQPQQPGGLFGSPATSQPQQSGGPFGSSIAQKPQGSLFGGGFGQQQQQQPQQQQQQQPQQQQAGGLFGSSMQQKPQGSLFGGAGQQQQNQQQPAGGGLFGGQQPQQQQPQQQQPQQQSSLFGGSLLGGQQQQPQQRQPQLGQTTMAQPQPQQQQAPLSSSLWSPGRAITGGWSSC